MSPSQGELKGRPPSFLRFISLSWCEKIPASSHSAAECDGASAGSSLHAPIRGRQRDRHTDRDGQRLNEPRVTHASPGRPFVRVPKTSLRRTDSVGRESRDVQMSRKPYLSSPLSDANALQCFTLSQETYRPLPPLFPQRRQALVPFRFRTW